MWSKIWNFHGTLGRLLSFFIVCFAHFVFTKYVMNFTSLSSSLRYQVRHWNITYFIMLIDEIVSSRPRFGIAPLLFAEQYAA